jgi:hypothetical protein
MRTPKVRNFANKHADVSWMGKAMLIAIALMLLADNSEASQSLTLACAGTLTTSIFTAQDAPKSHTNKVGDVSVIIYYSNREIFSSLFAAPLQILPLTHFASDGVDFDTTWENQGIKRRTVGGVDAKGLATFNEVIENDGVTRIAYWELRCKEAPAPAPAPRMRGPWCARTFTSHSECFF